MDTETTCSLYLQYYLKSLEIRKDGYVGRKNRVTGSDECDSMESSSSDEGMHDDNETTRFEKMQETQRKRLLQNDIATKLKRRKRNVYEILKNREYTTTSEQKTNHHHIPNSKIRMIAKYDQQVFCGQFCDKGLLYLTACQDHHLRIYESTQLVHSSEKSKFEKPLHEIKANDVFWSIVDCDYMDHKIIYSSWSTSIKMIKIREPGDEYAHCNLPLNTSSTDFCPFMVRFSPDGKQILAGASDCCVYLFDLGSAKQILKIAAHSEDVNTVGYLHQCPNVFLSGADDAQCKVWDKRCNHTQEKPVGMLVGHLEGISFLSSKGDGRYFISNSKDQSMKLWDIRHMKNQDQCPKLAKPDIYWDYRFQQCPSKCRRIDPKDMSLMTYVGHRVLRTLVRCYFSPEYTGQKYLYTGSQDGCVYIYDLLSGKIVQRLYGHSAVVRDVSWHPDIPIIHSTSWDCTVCQWGYRERDPCHCGCKKECCRGQCCTGRKRLKLIR